jgi:hypothetical protein
MKKIKLILVDGETATFYLNSNVALVSEKYYRNVVVFDGTRPDGWRLHADYSIDEIEELFERQVETSNASA